MACGGRVRRSPCRRMDQIDRWFALETKGSRGRDLNPTTSRWSPASGTGWSSPSSRTDWWPWTRAVASGGRPLWTSAKERIVNGPLATPASVVVATADGILLGFAP
jgi:hypothetical protein